MIDSLQWSDDQALGRVVEIKAQAAHVAAVALTRAWLRVEIIVTEACVAGRTAPRHGQNLA